MEAKGPDPSSGARVLARPEDLGSAAHLLTSASDPRVGVCLAAKSMLRAAVATLWERRDDAMVMSATSDPELVSKPPRAVERAIDLGERTQAEGRKVTMLVEPVQRTRRTIAALVVGWREPVEADATSCGFLTLLAAQAALAIERADLADELARQAETDPLTGVANRRGLARSLERDLAGARRTGRALAVAMVDLDHFKDYNDRAGHPAGDLLLQRAARAWARGLRAEDLLARYGGEEFAVVLPDCGDESEAVGVVERIRAATPEVSASAGVALWNRRETAAQLIRRADRALYEAKRSGRNKTVLAGPVTLRQAL